MKNRHWLWRNCSLSSGTFLFGPPCRWARSISLPTAAMGAFVIVTERLRARHKRTAKKTRRRSSQKCGKCTSRAGWRDSNVKAGKFRQKREGWHLWKSSHVKSKQSEYSSRGLGWHLWKSSHVKSKQSEYSSRGLTCWSEFR